MLAVGLTVSLGLQTLIIIGGNTKLIPLTGITLPFVSYGGSSVLASFIMVGLLLAVPLTVAIFAMVKKLFEVLGPRSAAPPAGPDPPVPPRH